MKENHMSLEKKKFSENDKSKILELVKKARRIQLADNYGSQIVSNGSAFDTEVCLSYFGALISIDESEWNSRLTDLSKKEGNINSALEILISNPEHRLKNELKPSDIFRASPPDQVSDDEIEKIKASLQSDCPDLKNKARSRLALTIKDAEPEQKKTLVELIKYVDLEPVKVNYEDLFLVGYSGDEELIDKFYDLLDRDLESCQENKKNDLWNHIYSASLGGFGDPSRNLKYLEEIFEGEDSEAICYIYGIIPKVANKQVDLETAQDWFRNNFVHWNKGGYHIDLLFEVLEEDFLPRKEVSLFMKEYLESCEGYRDRNIQIRKVITSESLEDHEKILLFNICFSKDSPTTHEPESFLYREDTDSNYIEKDLIIEYFSLIEKGDTFSPKEEELIEGCASRINELHHNFTSTSEVADKILEILYQREMDLSHLSSYVSEAKSLEDIHDCHNIDAGSDAITRKLSSKGSSGQTYLARHKYYGDESVIKIYEGDANHNEYERNRDLLRLQGGQEAYFVNVMGKQKVLVRGIQKPCLQMRFGGEDLRQFIRKKGPLSSHLASMYFATMMNGLYILKKEFGWDHNDIRPENIFVNEEGHMRLGDLGISGKLEGHYKNRRFGPPKNYDGESKDIFSAACVFYYMLTGKSLLFEREEIMGSLEHAEKSYAAKQEFYSDCEVSERFANKVSQLSETDQEVLYCALDREASYLDVLNKLGICGISDIFGSYDLYKIERYESLKKGNLKI
jgi:hypothetical protein